MGYEPSPWRTAQTRSFRRILDGEMLHAGEVGLIFPVILEKGLAISNTFAKIYFKRKALIHRG
jgi:hypothetical protein